MAQPRPAIPPARVYLGALASEFDEVVGLPKGLILPAEKGLEGLFNCLLTMESRVLHQGRLGRHLMIGGTKVIGSLG